MLSLPFGHRHQGLFESLLKAPPNVSFVAGETLFNEGEAGDYAIYLISGSVSVGVTHQNGSFVEIARLGACDLIGELGLVTGERCASARALEPVTAIRISYGVIAQLVNARPDFALGLYSLAIEKLLRTLYKLAGRHE